MSEMFGYQRRSGERITPRRTGLFLPYGSGKSWLALEYAYMKWVMTEGYYPRCVAVVFCKKRNLLTWKREIAKRYSEVGAVVIESAVGLQDALMNSERLPRPTFLLFPWTKVAHAEAQLHTFMHRFRPAAIIGDESTSIKNPRAQTTAAALRITASAPSCVRLLLTGNPKPESEREMWSQYQFAYAPHNPLGQTYYQFLNTWFVKTDYDWALSLNRRDEFYKVVRDHCIELRGEDLEEFLTVRGIEKIQYTIEYFEESAQQRRLTDYLWENWALPSKPNLRLTAKSTQDSLIEYDNTMALTMKAQQIAGGFYYDEDGTPQYLRSSNKLPVLMEVLRQLLDENPTRRIIVWYAFRAERELIGCELERSNLRFVYGPDDESLLAFAKPVFGFETPNIILMPYGITQGFNELSTADTDIFYSQRYSQELRDQAEARIDRMGQLSSTTTHIDICSPRMQDAEIITALQCKSLTQSRLNTIVNRYTVNPRQEQTNE
jgi:hypothetical protein